MFSLKAHSFDEKNMNDEVLKWNEDPELTKRRGKPVVSNDWERKARFCTNCGKDSSLQISFILKVRWKRSLGSKKV